MTGNMCLLCIAVGCILLSGVTDAQLERCQLSRLDRFPCRFRSANTLPGPNEYAIYRTKIRLGGAGVPECRVHNPLRADRQNEVVSPICNLGIDNLRIIFSPGFPRNKRYANQIMVNYSIQCPTGTLAFFNLTRLDLQERCANECVDYLQVNRGQFGVTESCGNDTANNMLQLELGTIDAIFRTSEEGRFPGFQAYIVCFNPDDRDMPGCIRVEGDTATDSTGTENVYKRRKRDLEQFHNGWRRRLKHQTGSTKFFKIDIAHGDMVTYKQSTLTIIRDDEVYRRIRNVFVLHTFDAEGNLDVYTRESSSRRREFIQFYGPGSMVVSGRHTYFQLFAIDPWGILPTEAEGMVIRKITNALTDTLGSDFSITEPEHPIESMLPEAQLDILKFRRKRQTPECDILERSIVSALDEDAIRHAILFENACNPVLRTVSRITIEIAERYNSTLALVDQIRDSLDCGSLNDTANGLVTLLSTKFGSTATYSCNHGYVLMGVSTRTCQTSGQWSDQPPVCTPVDCGSLNDTANGLVTLLSTKFGSTATYSCNHGYVLMGVSMRTCQTSGQWSDQPPVCTPVDCGSPNDTANGLVTLLSTKFGSTATYSCNHGYVLMGVSTRTCQTSGQWSDQPPVCTHFTATHAQTSRCLLSRLDRFPCSFRESNTLPQPNEYGIYRTNIRLGRNGSAECRTRNPLSEDQMNEVIRPISNLGSANLRLIFSPGLHFNKWYANQILVKYRVQCPAGRLAFYNITRLELQEKCKNECVDYVEVRRGQFGIDEYCGSDPVNSTMQLEFGTFDVIFRTSEERRCPGFEMYIVCVDPDDRDMPGCVNVDSRGRSKRYLGDCLSGLRMSQFLIAHGDIVTYSQDTITISRDGEVYQRIRSVLVLRIIDGNGNRNTFFNEATDTNGNEIQFFGPGPLHVNDCIATFQLFVINPSGILPTEAEGVIISRLAAALTATLGPQDDVNITLPEPPTALIPPGYFGSSGLRKKRQDEITRFIEEDAIRDAIRFENACNPVLRTTSRITIEVAERDDPDRVNRIRGEVMSG